jgi:adhesin transport system outer membrane protein
MNQSSRTVIPFAPHLQLIAAALLFYTLPVVFTAPAAHAQPVRITPVPPPSAAQGAVLLDVLQRALADHPAIKARQSDRNAAGFDLDGAKWGRFPSLTVTAQADENSNQPNVARDQRVARLEQPIWAGGRISSSIDLADSRVTAADATLIGTQQEVLQQTATAFFEVLRLEARLQAAKENTAEHVKLLDLIKRRVDLEASPESDRTVAESRAQLAKSEEITVNRQLETLRLQLDQLVGSPVGPLRRPPPVKLRPYASEEEAVKAALAFAPQRRASLAQADAAAAELGVAKSRNWPNLVAGYQQVWQTINGTSISNGQGFVGLQFQPGAGLSSLSAARAADSRRQAAVDNVATADRQVTAAIGATMSDMSNFGAQLAPARITVRGTEEVVESYLRQYQIGRKGWLDVLNAQRERSQAKAALSDVEYSLELSKVRFMLLTGDITSSTLSSIHD